MTVYEIITEQIIDKLEKGTIPWQKPWNGAAESPKNLQSGKEYRGINPFLLECAGFDSPYWLTFNQCKAKGGSIKAGSKSTPVIFWKFLEKKDAETGETEQIPMLRYYRVFNVNQCEGIEAPAGEKIETIDFKPIERAENIVNGYEDGPVIEHKKPTAFFRHSKDTINMPKPETFHKEESYYSTIFHEMTHSTGHVSRLKRRDIGEVRAFGSVDYSKEELIAEMGAAFLCGHAGIGNETINNSAAYIKGWVQKFRDKPKMVVVAAAQAQKAVDLILGNFKHVKKEPSKPSVEGGKKTTPKKTTKRTKTRKKAPVSGLKVRSFDSATVDMVKKDVEAGQAGYRVFNDPLPGQGGSPSVVGVPSTFPVYFQNKGYTKKGTLNIIAKFEDKKPLTEKQNAVLSDLVSGAKDQTSFVFGLNG